MPEICLTFYLQVNFRLYSKKSVKILINKFRQYDSSSKISPFLKFSAAHTMRGWRYWQKQSLTYRWTKCLKNGQTTKIQFSYQHKKVLVGSGIYPNRFYFQNISDSRAYDLQFYYIWVYFGLKFYKKFKMLKFVQTRFSLEYKDRK